MINSPCVRHLRHLTPLNDDAFNGQSFNTRFRATMASSAIDIDTLPQHAARDNIRFLDAEVDRRWSTRADEPGKHSPLPNGIPMRIGPALAVVRPGKPGLGPLHCEDCDIDSLARAMSGASWRISTFGLWLSRRSSLRSPRSISEKGSDVSTATLISRPHPLLSGGLRDARRLNEYGRVATPMC